MFRSSPWKSFGLLLACASLVACSATPEPDAPQSLELEGAWDEGRVDAVLARTLRVRLDPPLDHLAPGERQALDELLGAGAVIQRLYEQSLHPQALTAEAELRELDERNGSPLRTLRLRELYRLFQGPVATTLDNQRVPFLAVDDERPGKNLYPWDVEADELDAWLGQNPEQRARILGLRSVVRRASAANLGRDLLVLDEYPVLDTLHPGLRERLESLGAAEESGGFYAVPYSVVWPSEMLDLHRRLHRAADALAGLDADFAAYLRNRARDLLSDDYEAGDASWVTGRFGRLNAQIGSYETYDDGLFGVKSFFGMSILVRDDDASRDLGRAIDDLQQLEDALPYPSTKKVRDRIPVGVYRVVADFGQARGANTATILPNDPSHAAKYGRTILLRGNVMLHPDLVARSQTAFAAAVEPDQVADLTPGGNFHRTLWHEIGHYLGPDRTVDGRSFGEALAPHGDLFEELKSDLVSLYSAQALHRAGHLDDATLRSFYASGVRRTLQEVRPRSTQAYSMMQLMQGNYFLERGLLERQGERLKINYAAYHNVVAEMLGEVLSIQRQGDAAAAREFIERYAVWDEAFHGTLAASIREARDYTYVLPRYAALGE